MVNKHGFTLMTIKEFREWLPAQEIGRSINHIQNHCTWRPSYKDFDGNNHFQILSNIKRYHVDVLGWSDSGHHFLTFEDGMIGVCRPLRRTPAGIQGHNSGGVCIEHLGNFDEGKDQMTNVHRDLIIEMSAILCDHFGLEVTTETMPYHTWFNDQKTCPGTAWFGGNSKSAALLNFYPLIEKKRNINWVDNEPIGSDPSISIAVNDAIDVFKDNAESAFAGVVFWRDKSKGNYSEQVSLFDKMIVVVAFVSLLSAMLFGIRNYRQ